MERNPDGRQDAISEHERNCLAFGIPPTSPPEILETARAQFLDSWKEIHPDIELPPGTTPEQADQIDLELYLRNAREKGFNIDEEPLRPSDY